MLYPEGDITKTVTREFGTAVDQTNGAGFRLLADVTIVQKRLAPGKLWDPLVVQVRLKTDQGDLAQLEGDVVVVFTLGGPVRCKLTDVQAPDLLR